VLLKNATYLASGGYTYSASISVWPSCRGEFIMTYYRSRLLIAFVAISCFACEAQAAPDITQAVSTDCRWDYHNFCSEYGIGSPLLNYCFRNNGAKLSKACVNALIAAGDVSKAYVQARRRAGH
jgi:hypothetical protein